MSDAGSGSIEATIARYNEAWNAHDVAAIVSMHAPRMVFENHTAGERAEGTAVGDHIASIFANWPDLTFSTRRLYVADDFAVCEWTANATRMDTGERLEWDGVDVFPLEGGLIARKDVYSAAHRARTLSH